MSNHLLKLKLVDECVMGELICPYNGDVDAPCSMHGPYDDNCCVKPNFEGIGIRGQVELGTIEVAWEVDWDGEELTLYPADLKDEAWVGREVVPVPKDAIVSVTAGTLQHLLRGFAGSTYAILDAAAMGEARVALNGMRKE